MIAAPTAPPPVPHTIAEAILAVRGFTDLSDHRRKTIISSLSAVARLAGKPAEAVRIDAAQSVALLEQASAASLGVREGTLANYRAGLRQALRRFGLLAPKRLRSQKADHPAWTELLARLPDGRDFLRLRSFIGFCASEGIGPADVSEATLDAYAAYRTATTGGAKSGDHVRRVASQWNHARRDIDGWPPVRLGLTGRTVEHSPPFDTYLPGLQKDVAAYLSGIGHRDSEGLFTGPKHGPVRPATVTNHKYNLRRLLWGASQGGMRITEIDSLRVVTSKRFVETSLNWHYFRAGAKVTADLRNLGTTIASVGKYLELTPEEWLTLKELLKRAKPEPRTEISEHNENILERLDDPTIRAALLHTPSHLLKRAARLQSGWTDRKNVSHAPRPLDAAWLASLAVAIEVLLNAPLRIADLQALRLGQGLNIVARGRGRSSGTIRVRTQKTDTLVVFPLEEETVALIQVYLEKYRPALPHSDTNWVFPGQASADQPRNKSSFATAITEVVHDVVGVRVNPHAFRSFAGALILERNPHAIDDVRAVLGHSGFETSLIYYRRNSSRDAAMRLSSSVKQERRKTKLLAEGHFRDLGRTAKSRPAPWKN